MEKFMICKSCGGELKTVGSPQNGFYSICKNCNDVYIGIKYASANKNCGV